MVENILQLLIYLAAFLFLLAMYFSFKLSKETQHEKYWIFLAIGFLVFALHHLSMIPLMFGIISEDLQHFLEPLSSILGTIFISYAMWGLYSSMNKVKKRLE